MEFTVRTYSTYSCTGVLCSLLTSITQNKTSVPSPSFRSCCCSWSDQCGASDHDPAYARALASGLEPWERVGQNTVRFTYAVPGIRPDFAEMFREFYDEVRFEPSWHGSVAMWAIL